MSYKVLVISPSWVGDLVMSQSLLKSLHEKYKKKLTIDVFAPKFLHPLISRMPEVNNVITNPFTHKKLKLIKRVALGFSLRHKQYDEVFVLPNSYKSAIVPLFAKIKKRTGFVGEFRYGVLNNAYKLDKLLLVKMVDRFCALLSNGKLPNKPTPIPLLTINGDNQKKLCEKLNLLKNMPIVAFCPGAEYGEAKKWPAEYFAKLAEMLLQDNYQIIILGSKKDSVTSKQITSAVNSDMIKDLCGKTSLADAVDLLALSACVVTNDSGLMHISCAVGTKVVAIYGSTSPDFTPPLSKHAHILRKQLDCAPCFQRTCRFGHYNCLKQISYNQVYKLILHML